MVNRVQVPLTGGVNLDEDPTLIADNELCLARNVMPREGGVPGIRPSMSFAREIIPALGRWDASRYKFFAAANTDPYYQWARRMVPLRFIFSPIGGEIAMVCRLTAPLAIPVDYPPYAYSGQEGDLVLLMVQTFLDDSNGLRMAFLGPGDQCPSLFNFNGKIYAFGGDNSGACIELGSPGLGPGGVPDPNDTRNWHYKQNVFEGSGNSDFIPAGACVVRDRVMYWKGASVWFSDISEPMKIGDDANENFSIDIGGDELEPITAGAELSTSADGSPTQSAAAVWTRNACFLLLGETNETDADDALGFLGSLQINKLNIRAGCVSAATVTRTPWGTFWVGPDNVWFMPFGSLPIAMGTKIQPALQAQPQAVQWKLHAEYSGGFYRVSMFAPGQGPNANSPCKHQWMLDLRRGPPQSAEEAAWWGPQEYIQTDAPNTTWDAVGDQGVYCMARDTRADGDMRLFALQPWKLNLDPNAAERDPVYGMSLCSFDSYGGRDTCAPQKTPMKWEANSVYYQGAEFVPSRSTYGSVGLPYLGPKYAISFVQANNTAGIPSGAVQPDWFTYPYTPYAVYDPLTPTALAWVMRYAKTDEVDTWAGMRPSYHPLTSQTLKGANTSNVFDIEILTKEYGFDDPMVEKLFDSAEFGYWVGNITQIEYDVYPDSSISKGIEPPLKILNTVGMKVDPNLGTQANQLDTGIPRRIWTSKLLQMHAGRRHVAYTVQFKIKSRPGLILLQQEAMTMNFEDNFNQVIGQVNQQEYADFDAWLTSINNDINNLFGVTGFSYVWTDENGLYSTPSGLVGGVNLNQNINAGLAMALGYHINQANLAGIVEIPDTSAEQVPWAQPATRYAPDLQISGINLRARPFGRRPSP